MHQFPTPTADGCEAEGLAVRWQAGPIGTGFNGASVEVLIRAAIMRLQQYQAGAAPCVENGHALNALHAALFALDARTRDRHARGVLGQETP
jgi:hypothetical protein